MSNGCYFIELDSTWRNRSKYPNPGQFEVNISSSGRKNPSDAYDPVSDMAPINYWTSNRLNPDATGTSIDNVTNGLAVGSTATDDVSGTSDGREFVMVATFDAINNLQLQRPANYYVGLILRDDTLGEYRRIVSYTYIGQNAGGTLDKAIVTVDRPFGNSFAEGDLLSIYDPTDFSDTTYPQIFVPSGRSGDNAYTGYKLYNESQDESRPISNYDADTHILSLDTSTSAGGVVTGWAATDNYSIRKQNPIVTEGGAQLTINNAAASTRTSISITNGSTTNDAYNNKFLRIRPIAGDPYGNGVPTAPITEIRKIIDYDGVNRTASVSPAFSVAPTFGVAYEIELLTISRDNFNPFTFYGNTIGSQQTCPWDVDLVNVSLPNKILNAGHGRRIAYYPYVYIELENMATSSVSYLSSNNPNIGKAMFRCVIKDVSSPINSAFVNIDADKIKQTVDFKPNDNLKLTVRLPNGDIWKTLSTDTLAPIEPNNLLQVSACFKFTKKV